jgi:hypothetical protein
MEQLNQKRHKAKRNELKMFMILNKEILKT